MGGGFSVINTTIQLICQCKYYLLIIVLNRTRNVWRRSENPQSLMVMICSRGRHWENWRLESRSCSRSSQFHGQELRFWSKELPFHRQKLQNHGREMQLCGQQSRFHGVELRFCGRESRSLGSLLAISNRSFHFKILVFSMLYTDNTEDCCQVCLLNSISWLTKSHFPHCRHCLHFRLTVCYDS